MEQRFLVKLENTEYDIVVCQDGADFSGANYSVKVNGKQKRVSFTDSAGESHSVHALIDSLSYPAEVSRRNGRWNVFLAGKEYSATVANYRLAKLKNSLGVREVKALTRALLAPMPGLALQVNVAEGDAVKLGDTLVVLEAMKMENPIKATGNGTVRKVHVRPQDSVEKGMTLIEFAE